VLRLEIDPAGAVAESDETDNSYTKEISVAEPQQLPIMLSAPVMLENGSFRFTVNGAPSTRYDILSSSNLLHWLLIGDNLIADTTGTLVFTTVAHTNLPILFYRARTR
jgi:hypothetical protein